MNGTVFDLRADRVLAELKNNKRLDGRALDEYRKAVITKNVSQTADGSARVKIGETEVITGVKMFPETPYPDMPDQGSISVGVELLALASPGFESGPPREDSIELARVVDRGIRESKALDFKSFCITKGEKAWFVFIDNYALNYDGNLFDACSLSSLAALLETKIPKFEDGAIVKGEYSGKLKLSRKPLLTTIAKVGGKLIVDPNFDEMHAMQARFSVATTDDNKICAFQKGSGGAFTPDELNECVDLAFKKGKELRKLL